MVHVIVMVMQVIWIKFRLTHERPEGYKINAINFKLTIKNTNIVENFDLINLTNVKKLFKNSRCLFKYIYDTEIMYKNLHVRVG